MAAARKKALVLSLTLAAFSVWVCSCLRDQRYQCMQTTFFSASWSTILTTMMICREILMQSECFSKCHLTLNPSKCKYPVALRRRQPHLPYTRLLIGRDVLEEADSCRYLGRQYQPHMQQGQETCWNVIQAVLHLGWYKHTASHQELMSSAFVLCDKTYYRKKFYSYPQTVTKT